MHTTHQNTDIIGNCGTIEYICEQPDAPRFVTIISHPHPQHSGTMHNKVVYTMARAINKLGGAAIRYNYRGVGLSQGTFDHGNGETDDLRAVITWSQQHFAALPLVLGGFSFGTLISVKAIEVLPHVATAALLVAPPIGMTGYDCFTTVTRLPPTLIIQGGQDEVFDCRAVLDWVATHRNMSIDLCYLAHASHFFHGMLSQLRQLIMAQLPYLLQETQTR